MERFAAQGVTFVLSIILARLLDPEVYGVVAIVTIFITIFQVFVDSGFGNALIQKKDADDLDFSTVFYFNLGMCGVVYSVIFVAAPWVAIWLKNPQITDLLRVMGLTIIISGVKNIQQAYVSRNMLFKKFFFATLGGTVGAAVVGIAIAYYTCVVIEKPELGVWAIVIQNLFNQVVDTIILWVTVKWRPKLMFSWARFRGLFSFGWKLLVSNLLNTAYNKLREFIIGLLYSSTDLAFYNKGHQFPHLIVENVNSSIDSVLLPTMAQEQDRRERIKQMTRRSIRISTYLIVPMMVGLAACAEPLIRLLLTEKWLDSVFFLRIFCFTMAFYPIHTANLNAIKAMGKSGIFLILEIVKKAIGLTALLITMWISVEAMAISLMFTTLISGVVNAFPNRKLLGYTIGQQVFDMLPAIALSGVMGISVYCVSFLNLSDFVTLAIQVPLGVAIYIVGSKLFRLDSFDYIWSMAKSVICRKGKSS